MDDLIFLVKKYIVFISYFMYMFPLGKNNRTLVSGLDRCRCGNSQKMLSYLFNFNSSDDITINSDKKLRKIHSISRYIFDNLTRCNNNDVVIKIHLGIIDHTFIIGISNGNVYLYQSYIDVNPLVVTKLDQSGMIDLFMVLDSIAEMSVSVHKVHITHNMMEIFSRLFGVPSSAVKYEFDDNFSINTKVVDVDEFYNQLIDICWLYYDNFVKLDHYVSFKYLKKNSVEHMKRTIADKSKRSDDILAEKFDGDMIYYEFTHLVKELCKISNNAKIEKLYDILYQHNKDNKDYKHNKIVDDESNLCDVSKEWQTAISFIKNDRNSIKLIKKAIKLNILDKMDPTSVLRGELESEFDKCSIKKQKGGHLNYAEQNGEKNYDLYLKYKNRYLQYKL
ncbi:MAG: hypothetical protein Homavirus19_6 [Homavirus sp.]|uniref:Uncharacterized protein n=1 Tax=Homavirus sp. TaxID=2487769 RepID=A0A3G5A4U5_9VIRU|nr:MAG: hypothetical protein Homavirus19_6 [Homavirus sp.]